MAKGTTVAETEISKNVASGLTSGRQVHYLSIRVF